MRSPDRLADWTRSTALDPEEERSSDTFYDGTRPAAADREEEGLRT
jgi:hypothetical protein